MASMDDLAMAFARVKEPQNSAPAKVVTSPKHDIGAGAIGIRPPMSLAQYAATPKGQALMKQVMARTIKQRKDSRPGG